MAREPSSRGRRTITIWPLDLKNIPKDAYLQSMKSQQKNLEVINAKQISMPIFHLGGGSDCPPPLLIGLKDSN